MKIRLKPLRDQVMVITGATSGIGLAIARGAAARGARLVVSARNAEALAQLVREISAAGGEALGVAADVGVEAEVQHLADATIERFGGFDTWINNAGVSIYGPLLEVSREDHRRLFDTNYWGVVYGSLIAARHLRDHGGALINIGSIL
ncbi:MAG TPA: SDR family NAD(P)-dependent oxidoreductase, partial [Gammaproteobacteria bacterium]|nr:SDR family NAD(P)-dependent oxidoreductase [Gammaproteobacteria bacterium]